MTDLEDVLRERFALLPEPELTTPSGLADRLRRRHDRRRVAAPVGLATVALGATPLFALRSAGPPQSTLSPTATASAAPVATPTPTPRSTRELVVAGLTFVLPAELHISADVQGISQDVTRHDNTGADGVPSFATDVGLDDGVRYLSITVYEGRLAVLEADLHLGKGERAVIVSGYHGRRATTVSEIPPGMSPEMAANLARPSSTLLVRVGSDRTLLMTSTGFTEDELIGFAQPALARHRSRTHV